MGLSLMGVVMLAGSFNLSDIVEAQEKLWFCIPQFLGLFIFVTAGVAETNACPSTCPRRRTSSWPAIIQSILP